MKTFIKRFTSLFVVLAMCLSLGCLTAFAAEIPEEVNTPTEANVTSFEVASITPVDENIMPRGSISGYAQQVIDKNHKVMYVFCDAQGGAIVGSGYGVTVKTNCPSGDYRVVVHGYAKTGGDADAFWFGMSTNDEHQMHDLTQYQTTCFAIEFTLPDDCPSFTAQVWIYG